MSCHTSCLELRIRPGRINVFGHAGPLGDLAPVGVTLSEEVPVGRMELAKTTPLHRTNYCHIQTGLLSTANAQTLN